MLSGMKLKLIETTDNYSIEKIRVDYSVSFPAKLVRESIVIFWILCISVTEYLQRIKFLRSIRNVLNFR